MPEATGAAAKRYGKATQSLRESVRRNNSDAEFASEDGNEIVYIFDANVFIFHAHIGDNFSFTRDLDHLVGASSATALSKTLARLTADFLFSGRLPGQHGPAYVSVPHFEEILSRADRIAKTIGRTTQRAAEKVREGRILQSRLQAILDSPEKPKQKVDLLANLLPRAWISALDAAGHFKSALNAAFLDEPQGLVPLDRPEWGRAAGRLREHEIKRWTEVLPRPSATRRPQQIRDDAQTLQTIRNLYLGDKDTELEGKRRYLLVTGDQSLLRAVERRAADLDRDGIPFFVRSPQDYLPLLNLTAMSDALDAVPPDAQLRRDFRKVFDTLSAALEWSGSDASGDESLVQFAASSREIDELETHWRTFSKYVAVLSLRRHQRRADHVFVELAEFLSTKTGTRSAAQAAGKSVEDVRDRHVDIVFEAALQALDRNRSGAGGRPPRRVAILLLGNPFGKLLGRATSVSAFLDEVMQEGRLPPATKELLKSNAGTAEAQLLAACLFIAAEKWGLATQFARQALGIIVGGRPPQPDRHEAAYILALCLRFSMTTRLQFERAATYLNQNLKAYKDQRLPDAHLLGLRDEMELGSLQLTAAVTQVLSSQVVTKRHVSDRPKSLGFTPDFAAADTFLAGVRRLNTARNNLLDSGSVEGERGQARSVVRGLQLLSATNLVGAYVFERIVPGLQGPNPAVGTEITELNGELRVYLDGVAERGETPRLTQLIYYWSARVLTDVTIDQRAQSLTTLLENLVRRGQATETTPLGDDLEFRFIESWARREASILRPVAAATAS